jgi:hypothetical protein
MKRSKSSKRELEEEIDLLDDMLSSLAEVLEDKGIITQEEWEIKIKQRIKGKPSASIRDLKE